jgi:hypothetical protein
MSSDYIQNIKLQICFEGAITRLICEPQRRQD